MLNPFLKSRITDCKSLVDKLGKHYEYVSIFGNYVSNKSIRVSTHSSSIDDTDNECGFVIKVYKDGRYSEYSCNDVRGLSVNKIIKALTLNNSVSDDYKVPLFNEEEHTEDYLREDKDSYSDKEIIEKLIKLKDKAHKEKRLINFNIRYAKRETSSIFVSDKKCLSQKYDWINMMCYAVVKENETIKNCFDALGEASTSIALSQAEEMADKVVKTAVKLIDSKPIVPGKYTVITDPSVSGLIAHEAFGHGVEMDMFVKNRAKAKDYVGKYVASELVDMYDGAASCVSNASYFFDDDGIEAGTTKIIDKGILVNGISDALSAMELGTVPTGNGRRQSYSRKVYTRMTNTFFGKGESTFEEMLKSVKHGYYIVQSSNGMEDPKNWQIQCVALYGIEIVDGKLTDNYVSPVIISGYVVDLLKSISMVSEDVHIHGSGMCGKGYKEWVYVSDGGPYLKTEAKLG
ncbi:MAG: TldD/PmbA family protein [Erysipelotrichaceae bacterium]|nr:TldD/PmbA family protein [Erysipelotrichaceae bacterium]